MTYLPDLFLPYKKTNIRVLSSLTSSMVEDSLDHGPRYGIAPYLHPQDFVDFFDFWGFLWYRLRVFKVTLLRMKNHMFICALEGP